MARLSPVLVGIALALLTGPVLSEDKCRSGCHSATPSTFKFVDGTTYKYNLDGQIDLQVSSAEGQSSNTKIKATVLLTQLPQCNQILRLQNVEITGSDGKKYTGIPNIDKPVKLNFHDGHLEDIICTEKGDTQVSLNIKRAVASLLQANLKKEYETDVFGLCPTETTSRKEGAFFIIQKHRDLNRCSHRENIRETFMSTAFNLDSEVKTSPIVSSDYTSEQKIKNGILESVVATENYLYVPFSVGKSGVKAVVTTKLTLAGQSQENPKNSCSDPRTIIFENPHTNPTDKPNAHNLIDALKKAVGTISHVVKEGTAKEFINVVQIMRVSSKDDLLRAYDEVKKGTGFQNKDIAQKFYFNAITKAGTGEAVEVVLTLLKQKEIKCKAAEKVAYLGLSFVHHATPASVTAATELLDNKEVPREAYLGVGGLAGTYCKQHRNCQSEPAIKNLIKKYIAKLSDTKIQNKQQENDMVYVLKSVKNLQFIDDQLAAKVTAIAQQKNAPNRLRVAAIEACLADACNNKCRDTSINILKDNQQDSEIRIKAYLTAAQCPNGKVAAAVKKVLEDEPKSYQVNGYIVSHIRNVKASTNPDKELAKQHLGNLHLSNKYPIDFRRFSHNFEMSHAVDTLGLASTIEADLIYSQNGFLPRSTNLNLTADVFGHRYNFLEVETRQENLEKLMEYYMGPRGLLRTKEGREQLIENYQELSAKLQAKVNKMGLHPRSRRDVSKAEIDSIGKEVQIKTNELNKDLDFDLSVSMLGSEVYFQSFTDNAKELSAENILDKLFEKVEYGIQKAKNFNEVFHHSCLFMDVELAYPTSMGFPLKVAVDAASSSQLETSGKLDIMAILSNAPSTTAEVKLVPSLSVEIVGKLTLDAYLVEGGLKTSSNLYSSTGGAANIQLFNSAEKGYDLKYSLPLEKQELISANHELVLVTKELGHADVDRPLKFPQAKDFEVCADQMSEFIGLSFCVKINRPGPNEHSVLPFPLDGHSHFSITIEKEDLKEYHIRDIVQTNDEVSKGSSLFEVIGKQDVKLRLEHAVSIKPERYFKLDFLAKNLKTLGVEGRLIDTNAEKSALLNFYMDQQKGFAKAGVKISGGGNRIVYTPILDYQYPNMAEKPFKLEGQIVLQLQNPDNLMYTFENFKVITPDQTTIVVKGKAGKEKDQYIADISVGDGKHTGTLKGKAYMDEAMKVDAEMQNTFNPDVNFKLNYYLKHTDTILYDSKLDLTHGRDLNSKTNKVTMHNSLVATQKDGEVEQFQTVNEFSYPATGVALKLNFGESQKTANYDIDFKYNEIKFGSKFDAKIDQKVEDDYDVKFSVHGAQNNLKIESKRVIKGDKSDLTNLLEFNKKKYELKGTITHIDTDEVFNYSGDLVAKVPQQAQPYKITYSLQSGKIREALLKIQSGDKIFVDNYIKHDTDVVGHVKMNLPQFFIANGDIKSQGGNGKGQIVMEFVKVGRKVKGETTFVVIDPNYNLDITVFSNFEKDNSKKYVFSTHNKIGNNGLDSKNFVEVVGKKIEVNVKSKLEGDIWDGKQKVDAEVIVPNEYYLTTKLDREIHTSEEEVVNGKFSFSAEHKKTPSSPALKFTFNGAVRDTDVAEDVFDVDYHFSVDDSQGKNLNGEFALKNKQNGPEKWIFDLKSKLHGSVMPTYVGNAYSEYSDEIGNYKINLQYADKNTLDISGKYNVDGDDDPISGEIDIVLKTSHPNLAIAKYHSSGSLDIGSADGKIFEAKGTTSIFVDDAGSPTEATLDLKYDGFISIGEDSMETQNSIKFQKEDPISFHAKYHLEEDEEKESIKAQASSSITYGKGKVLKSDLVYDQKNPEEIDLDIKIITPIENAKNSHIKWRGKRTPLERIDSDFSVTTDGKTYTITSYLQSKEPSGFQIIAKRPDGKTYEMTYTKKKKTPTQYAADFTLGYPENNFKWISSLDANVESVDVFNIKMNVDCAALKLDKFVIEAINKGGKGGKKIQFTAKNANKNILSGSTDYKTRDENGKFTMEGSGTFKVNDQSKSANFKFSRQTLNTDKHGEQGIDISFDASVGSGAVDAEFKMTNKHFRFLNSLCEEKKQCSHIEIDSKVTSASDTYEHVLEANVDLRKIGLSHEFGLKSVSNLKGYFLDHTMDVHFESQDKSKYQYSLYYHPTTAGATLTTPKRIMAIEAAITPTRKDKTNSLVGHLYIFPDKKNKPNEKTALDGWMTYTRDNEESSSTGLKFHTPGLGKPLSLQHDSKRQGNKIEYTTTIDIFSKPNQKIVATGNGYFDSKSVSAVLKIQSPGLNIDIKAEEKATFDIDRKDIHYLYDLHYNFDKIKFNSFAKLNVENNRITAALKLFDKNIVDYDLKNTPSKESLILDHSLQILDLQPYVARSELTGYKSFKLTAYRKNNPNIKLVISSVYTPGQSISHNVDFINNGKKIDLGHASVKLNEADFLKSDYDVNVEEIKARAEQVKKDVAQVITSEKELVERIVKENTAYPKQVIETISKASPDFKPAKEYYTKEFENLKHELVSDKTLMELDKVFKLFTSVAQSFIEILGKYLQFIEKVGYSVIENLKKITEAVNQIDLQGMFSNVTKLAIEIVNFVTETSTMIITKLIEASKPLHGLRELFVTYAKELNEIAGKLFETIKELRAAVEQEIQMAVEHIKQSEFVTQLNILFDEFTRGEQVKDILLSFITEFKSFGENNVESPQIKKFIIDLSDYLTKKIKHEPVDDKTVVSQLARDLAAIINHTIRSADIKDASGKPHGIFNFDYLSKLPRMAGHRCSFVNYLLDDNDYEPEQFLYNVAFNPKLWFPPLQLQALIVHGQHIFTFDGKHMTFPGSCNYLLARDANNGNFTIAGTYANGFLTALTVSDKHDTVTIKNNGQMLLNNQGHEYPVHKDTMRVTKEYNYVQIHTLYGAKVLCDFELKGCIFYISGFYHGSLRGLLGNGNSEPYDDFTMANGKIVTKEDDFGNSYKMGKDCKEVKTVDHKTHTHNKKCTEYFTDEDSDLSGCFEFVPAATFRQACDHGMAAGIKDTVQATVGAYATACNNRGIPVDMPDEFVKCTNGDKPRTIDESFQVKMPGKAADVVFVIDETKSNEVFFKELVQNVITDLNKEFSSKKINDIEYHFIGYGGEHYHGPYHYTVGGKFTTKGKLPAIKFADRKDKNKDNKYRIIAEEILEAFGLNPQAKAYDEAIKYPFRAHALKTVIAITGEPCQNNYVDDDTFELITELRTLFIDDDDVSINLVTPFDKEEFSCKDAKTTNNVIGFNAKNVFTLSDAKKKPLGTADLRDEIKYSDFCVDYTLENGGNVFVSNNFLAAKGPARKTFATTVAHNIVNTLISTSSRISCECQRQSFYYAKNVCEKE